MKFYQSLLNLMILERNVNNAKSAALNVGSEGKDTAMIARCGPKQIIPELSPQSLTALNRLIAASFAMVKGATRAVLGEGPLRADIAFVGEQPANQEDAISRPFVGPAAKVLDKAMAVAGIDRKRTYVTNAVKQFKFELRTKRRIRSKPSTGEVKRCRWWLKREFELVNPRLVVAVGATAALALIGTSMAAANNRGPVTFKGRSGYLTVHPSLLLRMLEEKRGAAYRAFVADMKHVQKLAQQITLA
jgi:uracil-DNA glycosylase